MSTATRVRTPVVSWRRFLARFVWQPGEHVTVIGHTGSGKSFLARELLPLRTYSVVLGAKPRDDVLDGFAADGWHRVERWPAEPQYRRVLLWPRIESRADLDRLSDTFGQALDDIFVEGAWTVYVDELLQAIQRLGLTDHLEALWEQGRSLGVSLVGSTQRPAFLPLLAYSQATHLFLYRTTDERDLARLADIGGGIDRRTLRDVVQTLPRFAFAYVNTRTGEMTVSRAPDRRNR